MFISRLYSPLIGIITLIFTNIFNVYASTDLPSERNFNDFLSNAEASWHLSQQDGRQASYGGIDTSASSVNRTALPAFENLEEALRSAALWRGEAGPSNVIWIDGGERFSFAQTNPETRRTEIRAFTPSTGADELLFDGEGLTFPGTDTPFTYRSFQWAGDSDHMLFETNFRPIYRHSGVSDFYFYTRSSNSLQLVAQDAGTAELSPDGGRIGFEREGNLYIYEFATDQTIALTNDATEYVFNGRTGWVYEEEFMITQAWQWSPDGRYIAFWQEDESEVPIFQMTDYSGQHPEYVSIRYPKVGDTNPTVRIGVVDVVTGDRIWLDTGKTPDSYIPRIYWTADKETLAVVHLSRNQRELNLFFFDAKSGDRRLVMQEISDYWIDIFNFFEGIEEFFFFPEREREFYWLSDRDGYRHLYRYDYSGEMLNQVTQGEWEVTYIHALDVESGHLYYSSTEVSPLERHLYRINLDGTDRHRITQESGRNQADVSPNGRYFIHSGSNINTPRQVHLRRTNGNVLRTYVDGSTVAANLERRAYFPAELRTFETSDGASLDMMLIKPAGFNENEQYPVVLDIYGGPGAQSVYNQFETNMWRQYLAAQGFIVASVNNRGSGGRGREFEKIVYRNLGYWEAFDFNETGNYLASLPYVDENQMAIRGHSYGGYMVLYVMTSWPNRFQRGISAAPVTDWKLYDTIYTERYMDELHANEDGYRESSPTQRAEDMTGELLLVHSSMDENVHVQHTFQFARALIDHRIDAHLRIFPPGAHGVSYSWDSYMYLMQLYTDFLLK
ncbi:MAG: S9 family peptidase [Bacteroidetes bacterium]|nr:S9 family peptidase [Bacteroidota bacterium]MCH8523989.1 S9 family peptidase [Balneolales bacterium]